MINKHQVQHIQCIFVLKNSDYTNLYNFAFLNIFEWLFVHRYIPMSTNNYEISTWSEQNRNKISKHYTPTCTEFVMSAYETKNDIWNFLVKSNPLELLFPKKTSRLAGSLDFRPFFSQRNCQNTDLNQQM